MFDLIRSRLRRKLFFLYFKDPSLGYYLRELERELDEPVANVRRELNKWEKIGLFYSKREGNQLYYFLNERHPLYNDIRSFFLKVRNLRPIK